MISQKRLGTFADFASGKFTDKEFVFVLNHINQNPSYQTGRGAGVHYPPSYRMLLEDQVFDPLTGITRVIRFIPGEKSIWKDEQTPDDKIPKKNSHLEFINGDKRVDGHQTQLVQYLMTTNKNGNNPNRDKSVKAAFYTVDPSQGLKTSMDQDKLLSDATHFCYNGNWDEVAAYASVLGIPSGLDVSEVRYSLVLKAKLDPKKFLDGLNSRNMKRKYFIMEAVKAGVIVRNTSNNTISWKDGGVITQAPLGKDLIDDFVDASFTENGEKVFAALMGIIRPAKPEKLETLISSDPAPDNASKLSADIAPVIPQVVISDLTNDDLERLLEMGLTKGSVVFGKPMWYTFADAKYAGKEKFFLALKGDPTMVARLKASII